MATVNGVNYAKIAAEPSTKVPTGELTGQPKVLADEYTFLAEYANNDVILLGAALPKGAKVIDAKVFCPDVGGTATVELGISTDTDYFIAAIDNSGQAVLASASAASACIPAGPVATSLQPQLKCLGASVSATGKKLQAWITYVMD